MNPEKLEFLRLSRLPGRLTVEQAAWDLGFEPRDISILMHAKMLKPLGCPAPNGPKYFASAEIERCREDKEWLDKACRIIVKYWKEQNLRRDLQHP